MARDDASGGLGGPRGGFRYFGCAAGAGGDWPASLWLGVSCRGKSSQKSVTITTATTTKNRAKPRSARDMSAVPFISAASRIAGASRPLPWDNRPAQGAARGGQGAARGGQGAARGGQGGRALTRAA